MDIESILKGVYLFQGLSDPQLGSLANSCRRRRHARGDTIVFEGDPGHAMYIVVDGRVAISRINEVGDRVHLANRGPGEHFGEMSLLDGEPRSADVTTEEPTELLVLEREAFLRTLKSSPDTGLRIMAALSRRLRELGDRATRRSPVRERLALLLIDLAEHYPETLPNGAIRIDAAFTRAQLAERIGSRREVVSRELSRLRQEGLIKPAGRGIVIPNLDRLRKIVLL
ncbi:MAG TPA: Crp/Fnr family transcriptional regulator [Fimbriimonadaceae bacterium]|nr:Crp/Fnr family transcriptional regulator [Fimbriimonadaceae bacterium]